ncbi:MAG: hypothetical protein KDB74_11490, partial [Flavobacteriales bacterium]|nr:hypothetical protein [Flavobacteriales bacterium]
MIYKLFYDDKKYLLSRIVGFIVVIICANLVFALFFSSAYSHGGRLRGFFGNPNGLAMFCLFGVLFYEVSRKAVVFLERKSEYLVILGLLVSTLLLTGSRAALFSVIIFYVYVRFVKFSPFLSFLSLVLITVGFDYFSQLGTELVIGLGLSQELRLEGAQGISTASGRLIAWKFAWEEIQNSFYMGRGWAYDEFWIFGPIQRVLNDLNHQG